jgi:hypothetical protein
MAFTCIPEMFKWTIHKCASPSSMDLLQIVSQHSKTQSVECIVSQHSKTQSVECY